MKKIITICLLLLMIAAMLCGCGNNAAPASGSVTIQGAQEDPTKATQPNNAGESAEPEYPYDYTMASIFTVADCYNYVPKAPIRGLLENNLPLTIPSKDGYYVHQGACSDGTYGYFLLANPNATNAKGESEEDCIVYKVDMATWEILSVSDPIPVQHGNSVTYNSRTGKLVIAHCKPDANQASIVDPEKMVVEKVVTLPRSISAMTYNASRNVYVARNGDDLLFMDSDFNEISYVSGVNDKLGIQNILCDDNYIYLLNSGVIQMPGTEGVAVYDWNGGFRGVFRVGSMQETESLILHDGKFYVTFYTGNGGSVYELELDLSMLNY